MLILCSCQEPKKESSVFVIGSYTNDEHPDGLHIVNIDFENNKVTINKSSSILKSPSYLIKGKDSSTFFAVSEDDSYKSSMGSVSRLQLTNEQISLKEQVSSGGQSPCHLTYIPRYKRLMIANYRSGNIASIELDSIGQITENVQLISHNNHGLDTIRQRQSHMHFVSQSPWSENIAYSVDLGGDKIYTYQTDRLIRVIDSVKLPSGSGPRHLAFHPKSPWIYVVNELNSTVGRFIIDKKGEWIYKNSVSSLSNNTQSYAGGIQIAPSGKYLYISNRGENTIACFSINQTTGELSLVDSTSVGGDWPRFFTLTKNGQYMLVANQRSDNIVIFHVDKESGGLSLLPLHINVHAPACILQL